MPRVSAFYGITIEMYYDDHPPPHFHARYGDEAAKVAIGSGLIVAGELPVRVLRLVRKWTRDHRSELKENWERVAKGEEPRRIEPSQMTDMIKITDVRPLKGHRIRATFSDGAIKDIDLTHVMARGGIFAPIRDRREIFEQVQVNPESQTVEWPGEVDFDPDVLYGRFEPASGVRIERRTIREPLAS